MRRIAFLLLAAVSVPASALPGALDSGRAATLGNVSSGGIPGNRHNPAASALALREDESFKASLLNILNIGLEAGPVDNFVERFEDLEGCLEEVVEDEPCRASNGDIIRDVGDDSIDVDEAQAIQGEFAPFLRRAGRDAYVIIDAQAQLPSTPMVFRAFGGVFGADINVTGTVNASILDDELRYNVDEEDIETNTAGYLKTARFINAGVSYSRAVNDLMVPYLGDRQLLGDFYAGTRLKVMQGTLAKVVAAIDSEEDANGDDAFDRAEDTFDEAEETTTNVALDLGLMWRHDIYEAGLTLRNINSPSFDYGAIGVDCDQIDDDGKRQDCVVAASFADRIDLRESFELDAQATTEASVRLLDEQVRVSASLDLNAVDSPVGDEYQWLNIGVSYAPNRWWIPSIRGGYRSNLGARGIDSLAIGLTLFGVVNLDASMATESVDIDGSSIPRAASVSLGFEMPL